MDLLGAVNDVVFFERTDDPEWNLNEQEEALDRAKAFRKGYRRTWKDLGKAKDEAEDKYGKTSEEYIEANKRYYHKKAELDLVTDVVKTTRLKLKEAQAEVDKARLGGELTKR